MNEGYIALLTAIFTTIGVKVVERLLPSTDKKMDDATQIRQELRKEVQDLRDYVDKVETREDELRAKIRLSDDQNSKLTREKEALLERLDRLKEEISEIKKREEQLREEKYRTDQQMSELYKKIATK